MENRWSDRRDLNLEVDLYFAEDQLISCQSSNIGLGGAYLLTESADKLSEDSNVRLVFYLNEGAEKVKHALNARIVRLSDQGVGLKFNEFDTGVFRTLQQLITYQENYAVH